jgi:argininosuccinate lyase
MPQKKNPDVAELIRGKTGRVYGALVGLLTVMKGLPLAYNKDMQEDKEGVFDAAATLAVCLRLTADMLPKTRVRAERTRHAAGRAFSNATDLADHLARGGIPFREAHEAVGRLVAIALAEGVDLQDLPLERLREVAPQLDDSSTACSTSRASSTRAPATAAPPAAARRRADRARARALARRRRSPRRPPRGGAP